MPRIVAALFQDQAQAAQALQSLLQMGLAQTRITALGFDEGREVSSISGFRTLDLPDEYREGLQGLALPPEDRALFEQGLQRNCALIAARVDQSDMEQAIAALDMFNPVDLDHASREWAAHSQTAQGAADAGAPLGAGITAGQTGASTNTSALPGMGLMSEGADDLGSADLRTDETAQPANGPASTAAAGARRDDRRADREGVNELRPNPNPTPDPAGFLPRHMNRGGKVRVFGD